MPTSELNSQAITVEVAYATPVRQEIITVAGHAGMTLHAAILASGVLNIFPEIDLTINKVGIFGQLAALQSLVSDQDRIEIYRPLQADPKETRRRRAQIKRRL